MDGLDAQMDGCTDWTLVDVRYRRKHSSTVALNPIEAVFAEPAQCLDG
jgi:hypothetical protein